VAWQPQGVLDDQLLDEIGEWLCHIEKALAPFDRFLDFSGLSSVAVRTKHVFAFARKRAEQYAGVTPVKSALFSEDWVAFGIARLYESLMKETLIEAQAFRDRAKAAVWLGVPAEILKLEDKPGLPIRLHLGTGWASRAERVFVVTKSIRQKRASHARPAALQMRHITAFS
jgi:hypothetical protein